jgi:hypothetical protein
MPEAEYHVDATHLGVRTVVVGVMMIGVLLGLLIMPAVERSLGLKDVAAMCSRLIVALVLGIGLASGAERLLQRIWPSGRSLHVDQHKIMLRQRQRQAAAVVVEWDEPIQALAWHFKVGTRRALVPRGWHCLACRLAQGDAAITLYTFMPLHQATSLDIWPAFDELAAPRRRILAGRELQHPLSESPYMAQLHMAERERWQDGAELQPPDFQEVVENIATRVEGWPPERKT